MLQNVSKIYRWEGMRLLSFYKSFPLIMDASSHVLLPLTKIKPQQ